MTHYHRQSTVPRRDHLEAKRIEVVVGHQRRGEGCCEDDPVRLVVVYHTLDGKFLAEVDDFLDKRTEKAFAALMTQEADAAGMQAAYAAAAELRAAVREALSHPSIRGNIRRRLEKAADL